MKYKDPITGEYKELFLKTGDTLPIGTIVAYSDNEAPINWLLCDGREVSRAVYSNLFSAIGTTFGEGDGTSTFNLPSFTNEQPNINHIIKAAMSVGFIGNVIDSQSSSATDAYSCAYINELFNNKMEDSRISVGTSAPSGGQDGDIYLKY